MTSKTVTQSPPTSRNEKICCNGINDSLNSIEISKSSLQTFATQKMSTQADASATYTRYIPKTSKVRAPFAANYIYAHRIVSSEVKRRHGSIETASEEPIQTKRNKTKPSAGLAHLITREVLPRTVSHGVAKISKTNHDESRREKKKRECDEGQSRNGDDPSETEAGRHEHEESQHKSVLLKKEKSLRKAERLAKKSLQLASEAGESSKVLAFEEHAEFHLLEPLPQPKSVPESSGKPTFFTLPPWLSSPIRVSSSAISTFRELGIPNDVTKSLQSKGFEEAFAVQVAVLPLLLSDCGKPRGDILVSAATGSGKTLAYVLPMVADISQSRVTRLRGLIVMPTRDLVHQARLVCDICASAYAANGDKRVKIGVAVGNQPLKAEQASLMMEEQRYDVEAYKRQERHANARWESSSQESDGEDINIYENEQHSRLPNHISKYTSKVDILICTPGRLIEHLKATPGFTIDVVKWLVIDEADKLLDQSFQQWVDIVMANLRGESQSKETIRNFTGNRSSITKVILSATVTRDVGQLGALRLYRPKLVILEGVENVAMGDVDVSFNALYNLPSSLEESAIKVEDENAKPLLLLELLRTAKIIKMMPRGTASNSSSEDISSSNSDNNSSEDEIDPSGSSLEESELSAKSHGSTGVERRIAEALENVSGNPRGALIFTKSNETAVRLTRLLVLLEPSLFGTVGALTSTINNSTRRKTLANFRRGKVSILVASDLVSRGLDIPGLAHVINYDIPSSLTSYIHRVGRTARAGKEGHAWTLFSATEGRWFWNEIARSERVQRPTGKSVERFRIDTSCLGDGLRQQYEEALATLGQEASASIFTGSRSAR